MRGVRLWPCPKWRKCTLAPAGDVLNVFLSEEQREQALALYPDALQKLFWGEKAVGLKIVLDKATPAMAKTLLRQAWLGKAPRSVLRPEAG
jgi:hypothetical protein